MNASLIGAAAAALALCACVARAEPVQLEGDNWHAIVVRPVDEWVGDATARKNSLDAVRNHHANYRIVIDGRPRLGGRMIFQGPDSDPLITAINDELKRNDYDLTLSQEYWLKIEGAEHINAAQYAQFADLQSRLYREQIRREGDPETLESRVRGRKILGNVLAVASVGLVKGSYGLDKANAFLGSGIPNDLADLPRSAAGQAIPVMLPPVDLSGYETVSVRRIDYMAGMNGQILIALKKGWTPEDEAQALAKAVAAALGVGDTPDAIEASRAKEFAQRKQLWSECAAAGPNCAGEGEPTASRER